MANYHALSQCQSELGKITAAKRTIEYIINETNPENMSLQEVTNIQFNGIAYDILVKVY